MTPPVPRIANLFFEHMLISLYVHNIGPADAKAYELLTALRRAYIPDAPSATTLHLPRR